jgi:hypothetical protein
VGRVVCDLPDQGISFGKARLARVRASPERRRGGTESVHRGGRAFGWMDGTRAGGRVQATVYGLRAW